MKNKFQNCLKSIQIGYHEVDLAKKKLRNEYVCFDVTFCSLHNSHTPIYVK